MNLRILSRLDALGVTLLVSAVLHVVLIASLDFKAPDLQVLKDRMSSMDIVLVNTKTESKPEKADALAQANLNRGGNTDADRRMKSALPPPDQPPKQTTPKPEAQSRQTAMQASSAPSEVERKQQKVAELEKQVQELMHQMQSTNKVETHPMQEAAAVKPETGEQSASSKSLKAADLLASSLDMARLEAQIAKQQDEYQKRPKRKFIGARAQEYRFAAYVDNWRQKVEKVGSLNYPEAAKDKKLYGKLTMTVSIRADGSLDKIEINQSSGYKELDDGARRIVELAAPFAPFPENVRADTDILSVTRTWNFTRQDSLTTE